MLLSETTKTNAYVTYTIGSHKALKAIGDKPKEININE